MSKEENVLRFYVLSSRLKDLVRKGWIDWNVDRDRLESVADHIYGCIMLAIAMKDQYNYDVDIAKVALMIAIHETEEVFIDDLTIFDIPKDLKRKMGREAVIQMFSGLIERDYYIELITDFEEGRTEEGRFAKKIDKEECSLECKIYDEEGCIHYYKDGRIYEEHLKNNPSINDPEVKESLKKHMKLSKLWMKFWQKRAGYDENFLAVDNYAMTHKILKYRKEKFDTKKYIKEYLKKKEN